MSKFRQLLKIEYSNEYSMKEELYTGPFIYCGGGPLLGEYGKPNGSYLVKTESLSDGTNRIINI